MLSIDERRRAERILSTSKRARFKTARVVLRCLLSLYTHQPAESLRFGYRSSGKPFLPDNAQADPVEFNISHSGGLMLAAFSPDSPLGIDLEHEGPIAALDWIVKHYFSADDYHLFQNLPPARRPGAFLSAWTVKEAYGKVKGGGLVDAPEMDCFVAGTQGALPTSGLDMSLHEPYWLLRFKPQEGFTAAAALKSARKPELFFWEYTQNGQFDSFFKH